MFKSEEQVATFINLLEKFTLAKIDCHSFPSVEAASYCNKRRDELESFIKIACGITSASVNTTEPETLLCPDCGADMALRTNKSNGNKFYGCKKFPNCRGTRDEDGLSKAEREEKKYRREEKELVAQEGGFSFNKPKRDVVTEVAPPPPPVKTEWINPFAK